MKKLLPYLRPYLAFTIIAPLFMLLEVWMDILSPLYMSSIINDGVAVGDTQHIIYTSVKMVAVAIIGVIGGVGNMYFSTKAGYGFAKELRAAVYRKIQSFSFANIDQFKTGSLVTRTTNDIAQIQNAFTTCIRMLVRAPFLCIGGVAAILAISPRLSLVVLVGMVVMGLLVFVMMKYAMPMFKRMQDKLDNVNVVMQENLAGIRVIKAFGRSEYEKKRFNAANDELANTSMRAMRLMSLSFPLVSLIMNVIMVMMYWFGGMFVFDGAMRAGDIMAFSNYITQILMALTQSSIMLVFVSRAQVSFARVNEVLNTSVDIADGPDASATVEKGSVEFRNVSFRYPGDSANVLMDISFSAAPGETVAILGSTGAGKSTLVNLIPRLYDATEGSVKVFGADVKQYRLRELRGRIGVAPQRAALFRGTIRENLQWGKPGATDEEITRALTVAQAADFVFASPEGLDRHIEQGGRNLSGGQRQRLTIARALVGEPDILILDDSASALDYATDARLRRAIRESTRDMTVFIVSQRVSSIRQADAILVLDDAHLAGVGTHEALMRDCAVYREIALSQEKEAKA